MTPSMTLPPDLDGMLYTYRFSVVKVIDGDTVDVALDLGFHVTMVKRVRLLGINAPEKRGNTMEAAFRSMTELQRLLRVWITDADDRRAGNPPTSKFYVQTKLDSSDKYGRVLGRIWRVDSAPDQPRTIDVNQAMVDGGFAVPYLD